VSRRRAPPRLEEPRLFVQADLEDVARFRVGAGEVSVYTRRSPGKETVSEDAAAVIPVDARRAVLVVADGAGGLPAGEEASRIAVESITAAIAAAIEANDGAAPNGGSGLRSAILDAIDAANKEIVALPAAAATTVVVAEVDGSRVRSYHAGDSIVLVTGQRGKVKLQNVPHSPVGYAVEAGVLDADEAQHHEERHLVSNFLGSNETRIEVGPSVELAARDTLVLASDGLSDNLYVDEIVERVRKGDLGDLGRAMAAECRERMQSEEGHADDLTFLVFRLRPPARKRRKAQAQAAAAAAAASDEPTSPAEG